MAQVSTGHGVKPLIRMRESSLCRSSSYALQTLLAPERNFTSGVSLTHANYRGRYATWLNRLNPLLLHFWRMAPSN